jgi:hypothetical protein
VTNDKLSTDLKTSIERNELLRNELRAVQNMADQYEGNNKALLDEMQLQATQNEELASHLHRKERLVSMRKEMERELHRSGVQVVDARSKEVEYMQNLRNKSVSEAADQNEEMMKQSQASDMNN